MNANQIQKLRQISPQEFVHWGLQDVAYIRRVTVDDQPAYSVHAADGAAMAVLPDFALAQAVVRQNDLEPLSVH